MPGVLVPFCVGCSSSIIIEVVVYFFTKSDYHRLYLETEGELRGVKLMAPVFKIMITCPVTRKPVDTGMETSSREAFASNLYQDGLVYCRHCDQLHSWRKVDAFLEIDPSQSTPETLWRPNE